MLKKLTFVGVSGIKDIFAIPGKILKKTTKKKNVLGKHRTNNNKKKKLASHTQYN